MTLMSESSVRFSLGSKSSVLSVDLLSFADPVDLGVSSDGVVRRINKDDLVVSVSAVLGNPI